MIKCPKCKELIGDTVETCPMCFHKMTAHERILMEKESRAELEQETEEMIKETEEALRRRTIWIIINVVCVVLLMILLIIAVSVRSNVMISVAIAGYVAVVVYDLILIFGLGVNNCPHCGRYLYRNYGECCQWCGNRVR
ncbi:MAG: hypothetical protein K6G43_05270 [Lachnospiraceae bacterium]|nr:hypothetical protein [Lachnospiraceae bacterium]